MFPDTMLQASGCFVGVVLSSELPEDDRELFEDLLRQMSDLRLQVTCMVVFRMKIYFNISIGNFTLEFTILVTIYSKFQTCICEHTSKLVYNTWKELKSYGKNGE